MYKPSVKNFMTFLNLSKEDSSALLKACKNKKAIRLAEKLLTGICEVFALPNDVINPDVIVYHINQGDSSEKTFCKVNGQYCIASVEEIVEKNEK